MRHPISHHHFASYASLARCRGHLHREAVIRLTLVICRRPATSHPINPRTHRPFRALGPVAMEFTPKQIIYRDMSEHVSTLDRRFPRSIALTSDLSSDTGLLKYGCPDCDKRYARRSVDRLASSDFSLTHQTHLLTPESPHTVTSYRGTYQSSMELGPLLWADRARLRGTSTLPCSAVYLYLKR